MMITKFKLYESQRSDDALKLFFTLLEKEEEKETYFDIRVEKDFETSKLPQVFFEEFKILYFYYYDNGYRLMKDNHFRKIVNDKIVETPLRNLDNHYVKNQIKRYVKNSMIKKYNDNNNLYTELENNKMINTAYKPFTIYSQELKYISSVLNMVIKTLPKKLKTVRKFKI